MYQISQEEKDKLFREWVIKQTHKLEILQTFGFDVEQSIEMLKLQALFIIGDRQ